MTGNGILWVNDLAGDAVIEVTSTGEMEVFPDGWIQYTGCEAAHVEGTGAIVVSAGVDGRLFTEGTGRDVLWGHGTHESWAGE